MLRHVDPGGRIYGAVGTSNVNLLALWSNVATTAGSISVLAGNGRTTGSCLRIATTSSAGATFLGRSLDSQATWGVAFAFRISTFPASSLTILQFMDASTAQCDLRMDSSGTLNVTRGGTSLGTASGLVSLNAWVHIELKITFHPSAGTVYLAVNGAQKLNLTGQNTRTSANSSANLINLGVITGPSNTNPTNHDFDDVVIYDGQATDANGLADITGPIGDKGVYWLQPTGAGSSAQFTPDSGSNYARVNEATVDGDTSYVEDSTVGHVDLYALADLPAGVGSIVSAALVHYARKTDTGARQLGAELRSGGTNYVHATGIDLGNTYGYSLRNWGGDPATGAAWTAAGINALEIGEKVNS